MEGSDCANKYVRYTCTHIATVMKILLKISYIIMPGNRTPESWCGSSLVDWPHVAPCGMSIAIGTCVIFIPRFNCVGRQTIWEQTWGCRKLSLWLSRSGANRKHSRIQSMLAKNIQLSQLLRRSKKIRWYCWVGDAKNVRKGENVCETVYNLTTLLSAIELLLRCSRLQSGAADWRICLKKGTSAKMALPQLRELHHCA